MTFDANKAALAYMAEMMDIDEHEVVADQGANQTFRHMAQFGQRAFAAGQASQREVQSRECDRCKTRVTQSWRLCRTCMMPPIEPNPPSPQVVDVRPEVAAFAQLMEAKLRENDHKGGWKHETVSYLIKRLHEEYDELQGLCYKDVTQLEGVPPLYKSEHRLAFGREAADAANFAMMIADVCGALAHSPQQPKPESTGETVCGTCGGSGGYSKEFPVADCPACNGTGRRATPGEKS